MKGIALCPRGLEDIASLEAKELIRAAPVSHDGCIVLEAKDAKALCSYAYLAQSASRVLLCLDTFSASSVAAIKKKLLRESYKSYFKKKTSFKVECKRVGAHPFTSHEVAEEAGNAIITAVKKECGFIPKVSLESPDVTFFLYLRGKDAYFGIDLCGFNMGKRQDKIFSQSSSLRGTIAYGLVRLSGWKVDRKGHGTELLVDCFSGAATIPIEAALYATGLSVHHFSKKDFLFHKYAWLKVDADKVLEQADKAFDTKMKAKIHALDSSFWAVKAGKKNEKIAGLKNAITFGKVDVEWLDTKFVKNEVMRIVAQPMSLSKRAKRADIEKVYKELFYQAEFALRPEGSIVLCARSAESAELLKKHAAANKFVVREERIVWQGNQELRVLVFGKSLERNAGP